MLVPPSGLVPFNPPGKLSLRNPEEVPPALEADWTPPDGPMTIDYLPEAVPGEPWQNDPDESGGTGHWYTPVAQQRWNEGHFLRDPAVEGEDGWWARIRTRYPDGTWITRWYRVSRRAGVV